MISQFERKYSQAMHQLILDETDKRLAESESLQRTTTALLAKLTLDEVLEIVCTEVRKLTGAMGSAVLLKEDEGWLQVSISTGEPVPGLERLSISDSLAGKVINKGVPFVVNEPINQVQAYYRNPDLLSILVVPLRVKDVNIGAIDVVNKIDGFTDDDMRIISLFADQAAIAIDNARLHQQAEEIAIVEERQRLARELHDSVTQSLYSVTLFVDASRMALLSGNLKDAEKNLNELRNMAREAMLDMRLLIFELHPPILEQEGLVVAIQTRLESVETRSGVETALSVTGERRLPLDVEADLYRIAQEALNNVVKHSLAQKVCVDLQFSESIVIMKIWDNGIGFDASCLADGCGMGLRGMEERVTRIGGNFSIDSSRTGGTRITVEVKL
jgi:signal transduction histidine kinase